MNPDRKDHMPATVANPCRVCGRQALVYSGLFEAPVCHACGNHGTRIASAARRALDAGDITGREFRRITSAKSLLTSTRRGRKVSPSTPIDKEPTMARKSTPTTKSTTSTRKAKAAPAAKTATVITAAQVARDAGLSGPRFRAWLRANDMPRQWATKALAAKAVAAFKKATAK